MYGKQSTVNTTVKHYYSGSAFKLEVKQVTVQDIAEDGSSTVREEIDYAVVNPGSRGWLDPLYFRYYKDGLRDYVCGTSTDKLLTNFFVKHETGNFDFASAKPSNWLAPLGGRLFVDLDGNLLPCLFITMSYVGEEKELLRFADALQDNPIVHHVDRVVDPENGEKLQYVTPWLDLRPEKYRSKLVSKFGYHQASDGTENALFYALAQGTADFDILGTSLFNVKQK